MNPFAVTTSRRGIRISVRVVFYSSKHSLCPLLRLGLLAESTLWTVGDIKWMVPTGKKSRSCTLHEAETYHFAGNFEKKRFVKQWLPQYVLKFYGKLWSNGSERCIPALQISYNYRTSSELRNEGNRIQTGLLIVWNFNSPCWISRIVPTFDYERVRLSSLHCDFRDQQVVDVPRDSPSRLSYVLIPDHCDIQTTRHERIKKIRDKKIC